MEVVIAMRISAYSMIRRILALSLLPLTSLAAQAYRPPPNIVPLAVTYCHLGDSVAPSFTVSFVDVVVVGTDSMDEVLTHERAHDRMNKDSLAAGTCPGPTGDRHAQLAREAYAYCISDSVRVLRTHDVAEAGRITVERLISQFSGAIPSAEVVWRWNQACPRFAWHPQEEPK